MIRKSRIIPFSRRQNPPGPLAYAGEPGLGEALLVRGGPFGVHDLLLLIRVRGVDRAPHDAMKILSHAGNLFTQVNF